MPLEVFHEYISSKPQGSDPTKVSKNEWNDAHVVRGAIEGDVLVVGPSDTIVAVTPAAAKLPLVSKGAATAPAFDFEIDYLDVGGGECEFGSQFLTPYVAKINGLTLVNGNLEVGGTVTATDSITSSPSGNTDTGLEALLTHATYVGTAFKVNTVRAANTAFMLLDVQANNASQFSVRGDGLAVADVLEATSFSGPTAGDATFLAGITAAGEIGTSGAQSTLVSNAGSSASMILRTGSPTRVAIFAVESGSNGLTISNTTGPITLTPGGLSLAVTAEVAVTASVVGAIGLLVSPTHASYAGTAIKANTTRAANSAFKLMDLQANSISQFSVGGDGVVTVGGGLQSSSFATGLATFSSAANSNVLTVTPTHATYTSTAIVVNTTRAANSAFNLMNLQANSVSQFKVNGVGDATVLGDVIVTATTGLGGKLDVSFLANARVGFVLNDTTSTSAGVYASFAIAGVAIGSITRVGATSAVVYNTTSDKRMKTHITPFSDALERVGRIQAGSFQWLENGVTAYGVIAQQLHSVYPDAVTPGLTEADMWSVDYGKLTPLLIGAIQELRAEVESLRAQLVG